MLLFEGVFHQPSVPVSTTTSMEEHKRVKNVNLTEYPISQRLTEYNTTMDRRKMFPTKSHHSRIAHHKRVFCLFGARASFADRSIFSVTCLSLFMCSLLTLNGCGMWKSNKAEDDQSLRDEARAVFNDDGSLQIPDTEDEATQWSIILVTLPNPQLAPEILQTVQSRHGLISAYSTTRQGKSVIAYGRYSGPDDRRALVDLDRVREIEYNGSRPFAAAYLAPPPADALGGTNREFDLRTVKERFGPAAIYTLQVGVYGSNGNETPSASEIKEIRQAAERAVLELRGDGERAFYYHAPLRSMITIGVFGEDDFDGSTTPAIESMRLRELRKRFPHNLLNGQGIRETTSSSTGQRVTRLQPSSLVGIPEQ
jgi:hypothetical protein